MTDRDPFRRVDYRRFVAWKARIERELPFLTRTFGAPGDRPLVDLGCATGEHSNALAAEGHRVIGLDRSESLLAQAKEAYGRPRFVRADLGALPFRGDGVLGGAICVGNTLAYSAEDDAYRSLFTDLRRLLSPGAPFLVQVLNYRRIRERGVRHLPLNFRTTEDGELLYLRLLDPLDGARVRFEMLTLERKPPDGESRIVSRTESIHRSLTDDDLVSFLVSGGFSDIEFFGDYAGAPYEPLESHDLILVARA